MPVLDSSILVLLGFTWYFEESQEQDIEEKVQDVVVQKGCKQQAVDLPVLDDELLRHCAKVCQRLVAVGAASGGRQQGKK